jgi:hypothetical protein
MRLIIKPFFSDLFWSQTYSPKFGNCFTFTMPKKIQVLRVLNIYIQLHCSAQVYIHYPGQFLSEDTKARVYVQRGMKYEREVNFSVTFKFVS